MTTPNTDSEQRHRWDGARQRERAYRSIKEGSTSSGSIRRSPKHKPSKCERALTSTTMASSWASKPAGRWIYWWWIWLLERNGTLLFENLLEWGEIALKCYSWPKVATYKVEQYWCTIKYDSESSRFCLTGTSKNYLIQEIGNKLLQ